MNRETHIKFWKNIGKLPFVNWRYLFLLPGFIFLPFDYIICDYIKFLGMKPKIIHIHRVMFYSMVSGIYLFVKHIDNEVWSITLFTYILLLLLFLIIGVNHYIDKAKKQP